MRILLLYNNEIALELATLLKNIGNSVEIYNKNIEISFFDDNDFDLIVSYTYRYIISQDIISKFKDKIINVHNSYLPFNKGTNPNLWSIIDDTPKGVSIHFVNEKIDDGNIIAQEIVNLSDEDTLETSYYKLDKKAKELLLSILQFKNHWVLMSKKSNWIGSYHSIKESKVILEMINYDYCIKIKDLKRIVNNNDKIV